jgi:hypothetical protein
MQVSAYMSNSSFQISPFRKKTFLKYSFAPDFCISLCKRKVLKFLLSVFSISLSVFINTKVHLKNYTVDHLNLNSLPISLHYLHGLGGESREGCCVPSPCYDYETRSPIHGPMHWFNKYLTYRLLHNYPTERQHF